MFYLGRKWQVFSETPRRYLPAFVFLVQSCEPRPAVKAAVKADSVLADLGRKMGAVPLRVGVMGNPPQGAFLKGQEIRYLKCHAYPLEYGKVLSCYSFTDNSF